MALKDQPGDARDFAKAAARQFGGVQAGQHLGQQVTPRAGVWVISCSTFRSIIPKIGADKGRFFIENDVVDGVF